MVNILWCCLFRNVTWCVAGWVPLNVTDRPSAIDDPIEATFFSKGRGEGKRFAKFARVHLFLPPLLLLRLHRLPLLLLQFFFEWDPVTVTSIENPKEMTRKNEIKKEWKKGGKQRPRIQFQHFESTNCHVQTGSGSVTFLICTAHSILRLWWVIQFESPLMPFKHIRAHF